MSITYKKEYAAKKGPFSCSITSTKTFFERINVLYPQS